MPLTFDFPLQKLKTYTGINPRPDDFDAFWDARLEDMHALDANVELRPADFTCPFAECFDLFFTGVGGSRVHAKLVRPTNAPEPHPAVVMFHGYTGDAGDWSSKLGYAAAGHTVAALDCRGQGGLSEDRGGVVGNTQNGHIIRGLDGPPEQMLFTQVFLDTAQLAGIVMGMPDVDEARVGVTGGSQGGALTLACASLEPRVARAAAVFPFLCDYQRVWEMDQAKDAYNELKQYFRHFDPTHDREQQVFEKLGYIDVQHLVPRIRARTLMVTALMDTICPPSTQFAAYNKITAEKEMVLYPDFGHEGLPGNEDRIYSYMLGL